MFGINFGSKSSIMLNGVKIEGKEFSMENGKIIVDGKHYKNGDKILQSLVVDIQITGDVQSVSTVSGDITVIGNVVSAKSTSGDIGVSVNAQNVTTVSGDIKAKSITNAKTVSGDISI